LPLQGKIVNAFFCPEDGGKAFLGEFGKLLPDYMVSHSRRQESSREVQPYDYQDKKKTFRETISTVALIATVPQYAGVLEK
jgi:hypothetical protein